MPTTTTPTEPPSPLLAVRGFLRKFTVDEYHRMIPAGILYEGEPVELLEGYVVKKWENITAEPPSLPSISGFRKFTVAEYHKMLDTGILRDGERVELLEGYLVQKMSHNTPHGITVQKLNKRLVRLAPPGWEPWTQLPVSLPDSEPEPDGVLARGDETTFADHHPLPGEIGLIVEVSDSSLLIDRREKGRIYATVGILLYWIVNIPDRQVEVYTDPDPAATPPAYRTRTDYRPGDTVPLVLDGQLAGSIAVSDLLT